MDWNALLFPGHRLLFRHNAPSDGPAQSVPGLKKPTGGFIRGFQYAVRALSRILDGRHHDRPWPQQPLGTNPSTVADASVARINRSSARGRQFGALGDLIVTASGEPDRCHEEMPVPYAHESQLPACGFCSLGGTGVGTD